MGATANVRGSKAGDWDWREEGGLGLGLDWTEGKGWGLELGNFVPLILKWSKSTPPLKTPYDTQSKKSRGGVKFRGGGL